MYKPSLSEIATKLNVSNTYLRIAIQKGHCAWATCKKVYKGYAYMVNYEVFFSGPAEPQAGISGRTGTSLLRVQITSKFVPTKFVTANLWRFPT